LSQVMVRFARAPVAEGAEQLSGLRTKEPTRTGFSSLGGSELADPLAVHPDTRGRTIGDGLVPPPDLVSGGENLIVAENEQLTLPEGVRCNVGGVRADADVDIPVRSVAPMAKATANR